MKTINDMTRALSKIGELVTRPLDPGDILRQVVSITKDIMKIDVCSVYLIDPDDGMLVLAATVGLKDIAVGKVRIPRGEGITGRAAKQRRIVAVRDVTQDKRNKYIPITGEEVYRSLLSAPLIYHNETFGVINVQTKRPRTFTRQEKQLLNTIARLVSGLFRNARLYEGISNAKRELEQTHERLIESEKMAALGRLSATLSHELRNPLSGLKGAAQLLARKTSDFDDRKPYVNLIIEEVERLGSIVDDLLSFAKPKALQYRQIDANQIIEDSLLLHSEVLLYKNIIVRKRLSKLPLITADPNKFKQIVVNIILNASDAMPDGGELLVSSSVTINEERGKEVATFHFRDTGQGIPDEILENVFEPFYTTKHDGVGLGLAVCKSIIEQHRGKISIRSEKTDGGPAGTLISFELPITADERKES